MQGLVFMEAEHVFFFIFPWRNFLRDETEAEGGDIGSLWVGTRCFCWLGQDESSTYGTAFPGRDISQPCVCPVFSLLYAVVLWCSLHSWQMPFSIMFPTLRIRTLAEGLSIPCSHGVVFCQATDQNVENCLRLARKTQSLGLRWGRR